MAGVSVGVVSSKDRVVHEMGPMVRDLAERRDILALAAIAEMSLRELRMLCERSTTCSNLQDMIDRLQHMDLGEWETDEE